MATPAVRELALLRDYRPFDPNADNGRVLVFCVPDSTVTFPDSSVQTVDDMSVVLPNNAVALPRAFAGLLQASGKQGNPYVATPIDLLSDNTIAVQKSWLPTAALKPTTAIQIGDPIGIEIGDHDLDRARAARRELRARREGSVAIVQSDGEAV